MLRLRTDLGTADPLTEGAPAPLVQVVRYRTDYEDEGLMPEVARNGAGHRRYRPDHLRWLGLLERLRTSGMSIARMRSYVSLALGSDGTRAERADLLTAHARDIEARIEELETCLAIVPRQDRPLRGTPG